MQSFLHENAATVVIGVLLLVTVIFIIYFMVKMKKRVSGCCGRDCGSCNCAQNCMVKKKENDPMQ